MPARFLCLLVFLTCLVHIKISFLTLWWRCLCCDAVTPISQPVSHLWWRGAHSEVQVVSIIIVFITITIVSWVHCMPRPPIFVCLSQPKPMLIYSSINKDVPRPPRDFSQIVFKLASLVVAECPFDIRMWYSRFRQIDFTCRVNISASPLLNEPVHEVLVTWR